MMDAALDISAQELNSDSLDIFGWTKSRADMFCLLLNIVATLVGYCNKKRVGVAWSLGGYEGSAQVWISVEYRSLHTVFPSSMPHLFLCTYQAISLHSQRTT